MRFLRSLFVWLGIAVSTAGFGLPAILAAYVPPRGDWFLSFARGWSRTILAFSRISVTMRHAERLAPGRSFVVVSNHESYADVLVLLSQLPMQVRFLAKRSIFRVPILGWSIHAAGFVPVDRGDAARSVSTVDTALKRLRSGKSLVVFPEETRTRTGELAPFKKGAALLALKTGHPLLPVGIAGTRNVLPRGAWNMKPGRVVLAIGTPIEVAGRSAKDRSEVMRQMEEAVTTLRSEAAAVLST
ncbi:MAG TPA: lysophospholipid acyltransferase family protein [Thermoanaerobaculia bacterium]